MSLAVVVRSKFRCNRSMCGETNTKKDELKLPYENLLHKM